jgi:hypothetical protein
MSSPFSLNTRCCFRESDPQFKNSATEYLERCGRSKSKAKTKSDGTAFLRSGLEVYSTPAVKRVGDSGGLD